MVGYIPSGGPLELFLIPTSAPQMASLCLEDGAYKRSHAADQKLVLGQCPMLYTISYQAAISNKISNILICFCNFDLSWPILEKLLFIENMYIVLFCLIKFRYFLTLFSFSFIFSLSLSLSLCVCVCVFICLVWFMVCVSFKSWLKRH